MAVHARPTLAPALVAPLLLGLLARPLAMVCAQVHGRIHSEGQCMLGIRLHALADGLRLHWGRRSGQHLHTCTSDAAATGVSCTSDGDGVCASSNAGFSLNGSACQTNSGAGTNGTAATRSSCTSVGDGLCTGASQDSL